MAGNQTGIIGSEFPFFNYLIYLVSLIFGYDHWYGRVINLIVSSIGVYYFYRLIAKITNHTVAFASSLIFISSIWFAFSRKMMPDTFSVSLVIIGIYYCMKYLSEGSTWQLMLYFLFATLGTLCKIPAVSLLTGLVVLPFLTEIPAFRKRAIYFATALLALIVYAWYFVWVPHLVNQYRYQLYFPKALEEGFQEIVPLVSKLFERFYFSALHSYIAFACCLIGAYLLIKSKNHFLKVGVASVVITFLVFVLKTGAVFPLHNYYVIPFVPVMAFMAGYGIQKIPVRFRQALLIAILSEGILNQQHDFFVDKKNVYLLELETTLQEHIPAGELIVINGGQSPKELYFSHRKGWTVDSRLLRQESIDSLHALGATFLVVNRNTFTDSINWYPLSYSDQNYALYFLGNE